MPAYSMPSAGYYAGRGRRSDADTALQLLLQLVKQSQSSRDEARQANESRYQDILELFGVTRGRTLGDLEQFGSSLVSDAERAYQDKRNNLIGDLANRGLGGSTARIAVEMASQRERDAAVNRIKDMLRENRSAADERFSDKAAGVMERRTDAYPQGGDMGALVAQLAGIIGTGNRRRGGMPSRANASALAAQLARLTGQLPAAPAYAVDTSRAAWDAQQRGQDELARRRAMGGLTAALRKGGLEGEDQVQQALAYLQSQGWAEQNPNVGTPTVDVGEVYYGGGAYGPTPPSRSPRMTRQQRYDRYMQQVNAVRIRKGLEPFNARKEWL